jgi:hypothetical protein
MERNSDRRGLPRFSVQLLLEPQQLDVIEAPEPGESREFHIGRGIQHVRIEEDPVQDEATRKRPALPALCRPTVLDTVGIEARTFHFGPCTAIVLGAHRIIQEKFGPALQRIDLDREYRCWPDQNSVCALFGDNKRSFLDAQAAAELRRQHDGTAAADLAG